MNMAASASVVFAALVAYPSLVLGDQFQLVDAHSGAFISNRLVRILDGDHIETYTDQYGRFTLNLPHDNYRALVEFRGRPIPLMLRVDGSDLLKIHAIE